MKKKLKNDSPILKNVQIDTKQLVQIKGGSGDNIIITDDIIG